MQRQCLGQAFQLLKSFIIVRIEDHLARPALVAGKEGLSGNLERLLKSAGQAVPDNKRVLEINPENVDALTNRGVVLLDLGQREKALASFEVALAVVPGHREAGLRSCGLLKGLGRLEEAQAGYAQVLTASPDDVAVVFNRGLILAELGRIAEALTSYDRALAIKPDYVEVLINRGIALTRSGSNHGSLGEL